MLKQIVLNLQITMPKILGYLYKKQYLIKIVKMKVRHFTS